MPLYAVENTSMRIADHTALTLRNAGFSGSTEFDRETATILLRTNATKEQIQRLTISVLGPWNLKILEE